MIPERKSKVGKMKMSKIPKSESSGAEIIYQIEREKRTDRKMERHRKIEIKNKICVRNGNLVVRASECARVKE